MFRLSLNPVFDSYLLVAAVALVLAGLMWFGPSRQRTAGRHRAMLVLLRAGVIALLLLAMLRPTLIYTSTKKQPATLVVLVDATRSMSVPDAVGQKTRWEALRGALADAAPALKKLARDFTLKAYTFDAELHEASVEGGKIELPDKPTGQQTAIGASLKDALDREAGKRLLGVILLSDGAQQARAPRDLPPQTAAARLKALGYPLFAVPFGQSRGLGDGQDVAVKDLVVNPNVFVKNELTISGQVSVYGYVNVAIPVRVLFETAPGQMEIVAEQTIRATSDGQLLPVRLSYVPLVPGERKLTLQAAEQPGELATTNNELSTFVNVLKGGLNVLYVEGALRVEEKFLRRALGSSPDIKVDYVRLEAREPRSRPADFADRFKPGKYDVYILGDVDSTAFASDELAGLADCVSRGAGLIMLGGFQTFGPGGYESTPLSKVLPVGMDRLERQQPDEPVRTDLHWPGPLADAADAAGADALRPVSGPEPAGERGDVVEAAAAGGSQQVPRPGSRRRRAGRGRPGQAAAGGPQLRRRPGDGLRRRFHLALVDAGIRAAVQAVLAADRPLAGAEGSGSGGAGLGSLGPAAVCAVGAGRVHRRRHHAQRRAGHRRPVQGRDRPARRRRRPLTLVRQAEQMIGSFRDTQTAGDYAIEVTATQKDQPLGTARARFLVFRQDLELDNASADSATLESLAAMTGGQCLPPEQLPEQIRKLAEETKSLEVQQETKKSFWDTWYFFLVLVGLLAVEWYLRKRWGLV